MMPNLLAEPRCIAWAGDWHENGRYAAHAIQYAARSGADVLIHLGDFGYSYSADFLTQVSTAAEVNDVPVLFVDGNHESFPRLHSYPIGPDGLRQITDNIWHLPRGFRWTWGGIRFLALGGAHSVDRPYRVPGVSWWAEEAITDEHAAHAISGGPADVLVSHDCPTGVMIPGIDDRTTPPPFPPLEILRSNEHRQVLRGVVDQVRPRAIWHGHYHVRYDTTADLGYGPVTVNGLDCDGGKFENNVKVVNLADLKAEVSA